MQRVILGCHIFWERHPALLYGLTLLLACGVGLSGHPSLAIPLIILYIPLVLAGRRFPALSLRLLLSVVVFFTAMGLCQLRYQWPELPRQGTRGRAEISLSKLSLVNSSFGTHWALEGELRQFIPLDPVERHWEVRHAPVRLTVATHDADSRPRADVAYRLVGTLKQVSGGYQLKVPANSQWTAVPGSWSSAEWRFQLKQAVGAALHAWIPHPRSAGFLTGLLTGDFSDRQIRSSLGRFGLQHVMAISGFHFAVIANLLALVLGVILPRRVGFAVMIVALTGYWIFLGPGASIARAWIAAMVVLAGQLLAKRPRGLNSLGVALFVLLVVDPTLSQSVAFQLSFLATASILLLYPAVELAMRWVFPKRRLSQVVQYSFLDQHGIIVLAWLRNALALGIAVHIVMVPMTLYAFQKFPLFSIVFNLFFPFLISVSMILLLLALPMHVFFNPLAHVLHSINSRYTQWVLDLTLSFPTSLDMFWRVNDVSTTFLISYLTLVALLGAVCCHWMEKEKEDREVFAFL